MHDWKEDLSMARANAKISKETLCFICTRIGVTADFLSQRTGFSEQKITTWLDISNDSFPTINQAKSIAKILKIPFAGLYMTKDNIPIKQLPSLRNLRTLPSLSETDDSALNLAISELMRYCDLLTLSEREMDIEPTSLLLPTLSDTASVVDCASTIRTFFELNLTEQFETPSARQFYLYIREKIERKGIFVHCFTGVDIELARGVSIYNDAIPIIGINDSDRYPAKTFSIIHELVHIIKRQSTLCNEMYSSFSRNREEVFCNAVAGEVLVPEASLGAYLEANNLTNISLDTIDTISKRFSVSKEVVTRRLFDTGKLSKDVYDTYNNEIKQMYLQEREAEKIARREGGSQGIPRNMSREAVDKTSPSICKVLLIGHSDGYFSKQEVSGFLGIKEQHVPKFFAEVAKWKI
jgi:Zn-dependent peptidase ImmA (M78 family)